MNITLKSFASVILLAGAVSMVSCDDWTNIESQDLNYNTIDKADPEGYARYLENLRAYRGSDHKKVYVWFENSNEYVGQSKRLTAVPDSVDAVILNNPEVLSSETLADVKKIREDKGMEVLYTIDFDAFKAAYTAMQESATEENPLEISFREFMSDSLSHALRYQPMYSYDGIMIGYNGKNPANLSYAEAAEYKAQENLFIGLISDWHARNPQAKIDFIGKPQNLMDKSLLDDCRMVFLSQGLDASNSDLFSYYLTLGQQEGVPAEKLGMVAIGTSVDPNLEKQGYFIDGSRAVQRLGEWGARNYSQIAGIGIFNVQDDYYNPDRVYPYTRDAIQAVNPCAK